jgi:O-antigen ligase
LVLALCAVVTGLAIHLFFPGVIGRFVENLTPSNVVSRELSTRASRLADYPFIVEEFSNKPLVGRGVGTFTHDRFFFVDNQYLKYLVELGLFGMSAMLVLFIAAAVALTRRGGRIGGPAGALVSAAGISAWVYALVNATFDAQGFPQVPYTFYMLLGLGVATALNSAREQSARGLPDGASAVGNPT